MAFQEHFNKKNPTEKHIMAIEIPSILKKIGNFENKAFDEEYKIFEKTKEYSYKNINQIDLCFYKYSFNSSTIFS